MNTFQALLLGAMLVWTPSLVFLAFALWRAPLIGLDEDSSSALDG